MRHRLISALRAVAHLLEFRLSSEDHQGRHRDHPGHRMLNVRHRLISALRAVAHLLEFRLSSEDHQGRRRDHLGHMMLNQVLRRVVIHVP